MHLDVRACDGLQGNAVTCMFHAVQCACNMTQPTLQAQQAVYTDQFSMRFP
jgi:hypothetical protein